MMTLSESQSETRLYDIILESKKYGLVTKADCIIFDWEKKEAYPTQYKYSFKPKSLYQTYFFQLFMEALIIEEQFSVSVTRGYLKFEKSGELVAVDLLGKEQIIYTIQQIRSLIQTESFPMPTCWKKRCADCCYQKLCWS